MASLEPYRSFGTDAIHVGQEPEQWASKAIVPPITLSTTYKETIPGVPVSLVLETK